MGLVNGVAGTGTLFTLPWSKPFVTDPARTTTVATRLLGEKFVVVARA